MPQNFWDRITRWLLRCWHDPLKRTALIAVVASFACLALLAGPPYFSTASQPARFTRDPGLEVQTVRDVEDLRLTLGDSPSQDRETMRIKLYIDFAFIAAYTATLVTLGLVLARRSGWKRAAGVAAAICGLAAGVFDVLENLAIFDILDVRIAATSDTMLAAIRRPSSIKWMLAAACISLLASFVIRRQRTT